MPDFPHGIAQWHAQAEKARRKAEDENDYEWGVPDEPEPDEDKAR